MTRLIALIALLFAAPALAQPRVTASGSTTPARATGTPSDSVERSIAGRLASELCVDAATTWLGMIARMNRPGDTFATPHANGTASSHSTMPTALTIAT